MGKKFTQKINNSDTIIVYPAHSTSLHHMVSYLNALTPTGSLMYYLRPLLLIALLLSLLSGCSKLLRSATGTAPTPTAEFVKQLVEQKIIAPEKLTVAQETNYFKYGLADLNGNGHQEIYILMQHPYFCGSGGCSGYLFDDQGNLLSEMTVTREPVLVSDHMSHGWKDLYVWSNGSLRRMAFDGTSYPTNPSLEPAISLNKEEAAAKAKVKGWEIYIKDGYQLQPAEDIPILHSADIFTFSFLHYGDPDVEYRATINSKTGETHMTTRSLRH